MRAAPPVSAHCNAGAFWPAVHGGLAALSSSVLAFWGCAMLEWSGAGAVALALAVGLGCGAVAALATPRREVALSWDGEVWRADGRVGELEVMLDLGRRMLLRLRTPGEGLPRWLAAASAATEGAQAWHALRVAVYSRAPSTPSQPAGQPLATRRTDRTPD